MIRYSDGEKKKKGKKKERKKRKGRQWKEKLIENKSQQDRGVKIPIKPFLMKCPHILVLQYDSDSCFCYLLAVYLKPQ